jgi:subtilase family serine protease
MKKMNLVVLAVISALALNAALAHLSLADDSFEARDGDVLMPNPPVCMTVDYKVTSIKTAWVGNGTQITATISRGSRFPGYTGAVEVDLYDYSQYRGTQSTPAFGKAMTKDVVFVVPYNIYQPDAHLRVIADPRDRVRECNERNNSLDFVSIG